MHLNALAIKPTTTPTAVKKLSSCFYGSEVAGTIPGFVPYTPSRHDCSAIPLGDKTGDSYCVVCI